MSETERDWIRIADCDGASVSCFDRLLLQYSVLLL